LSARVQTVLEPLEHSAARLWKLFRDQAECGSGISLKLFGFIAESVFTFIPKSCSGSPRISVRNRPGIAFTFDRILQKWERPFTCGWPAVLPISGVGGMKMAPSISDM
jgi:hypothetical protein